MKNTALLIFFFSFLSLQAQKDSTIYKWLKTIPNIEIETVNNNGKKSAYVIMFPQLIDHNNPAAGTFKQRVFLWHTDFNLPVVMTTEGYAATYAEAANHKEELCTLFSANQLIVEHRYFGKSIPSPVDWKYLNLAQATADYHAIRAFFGQKYVGKWISTGISKGGQTCLAYRSFYPNDVDITVAYVAPINFELEDSRIYTFLDTVGTDECSKQVRKFQIALLKNRKKILPMYQQALTLMGMKMERISAEDAFCYEVLEFPFSFWQWGSDCDKIPDKKAAPQDLLMFLLRTVSPHYYTKEGIESLEAFFYQAYTELGYYEYDEKPFKKWLPAKDFTNRAFAPQNVEMQYNPTVMRKVSSDLLQNKNKTICIYGQFDPWGSTALNIQNEQDMVKMVQEGGSHATRIGTLPNYQQKVVLDSLEKWLGVKVNR
jgi:hypothetical protein